MRDDGEITVIESDGSSGFKWFLLGAALGAGIGILFAPQSGERTRREIVRRSKRVRARAENMIEDISDDIQERGRRIKDTAEEFVEDVRDEVKDRQRKMERGVSHARDEMERRLSDARARARAAVGADASEDEDESD